MCNLLFEMEQKLALHPDEQTFVRLHRRMRQVTDEAGYYIHNPLGEDYSETRTDVEASIRQDIAGKTMRIRSVLKPAVYRKTDGGRALLVQRGVVIVDE
jgi:hypothetical protein